MICEFCGGTTAKKAVKKQHWLKAKLYIIENVEAEVCTSAGRDTSTPRRLMRSTGSSNRTMK